MIASRDHAALMTAILDDPDDDLPRLAFADYCEEVGEVERGELVRVQLEFASLQSTECACGYVPHVCCAVCDLRRRERQLLEAHGAEWCEWLAHSVGLERQGFLTIWDYEGRIAGYRWLWRRGFIEEIHAPLADWLRLSSEWLKKTPLRVYKPLKLPGERLDSSQMFSNVTSFWRCENVGRLHTVDLTSVMAGSSSTYHWCSTFIAMARYAFRPWRGLKRVVMPSMSAALDAKIEWWEKRIPGVEVVFRDSEATS